MWLIVRKRRGQIKYWPIWEIRDAVNPARLIGLFGTWRAAIKEALYLTRQP